MIWTIPAERMKMRREPRVPLTQQAIQPLQDLHPYTGHAELVFPGLQSQKRLPSENTMNVALRCRVLSDEEMTSRDLRATDSTLLKESGKWLPDVIEKSLAHQGKDPIGCIYSQGEYWQERIAMEKQRYLIVAIFLPLWALFSQVSCHSDCIKSKGLKKPYW